MPDGRPDFADPRARQRGPLEGEVLDAQDAGVGRMAALDDELQRLAQLARLMDARFSILGIRIGLDGLLGLVPGIGDTLALLPGLYILYRAREMGLPRRKLVRMGINSGLDYVIGTVPLVGDLFDIGYKANLRNVEILRDHFGPR